jgi:hypothetical protein
MAFVFACEGSRATRIRANTGGGAYELTLARDSDRELATAVRGIIDDMQRHCGGSYEVVGIDSTPNPDPGYYLAADDEIATGPYRTRISFECGEPAKTALNHRLYLLAGPTTTFAGHGEHLDDDRANTCVETWDCPVGVVCEARPCPQEPAK